MIMVMHGPLIFDSGDARWLMEILRPEMTLVAGVMARTAAEESALPVRFCDEPPSRVLMRLRRPAFLANRGKTVESGRIFGGIVASRLGDRGLVHCECSNATICVWGRGDTALAHTLAHATGFAVVYCDPPVPPSGGERTIGGCIAGEPVCVNGIVIGSATASEVVLRTREGVVEIVAGLAPKDHGLEKLAARGPLDLAGAWCKSGSIRTLDPARHTRPPRRGRVVTVDHTAVSIYRDLGEEVCGVLAIGDDTSAVCGHICSHRGIPVLGIVDGDADGIVPEHYPEGSVILFVQEGRDDDLGREVARTIPHGEVVWEDWLAIVLARFGGRVRVYRPGQQDTAHGAAHPHARHRT